MKVGLKIIITRMRKVEVEMKIMEDCFPTCAAKPGVKCAQAPKEHHIGDGGISFLSERFVVDAHEELGEIQHHCG